MTDETPRSIVLNNTSGRHNKTYRIQLVRDSDGWRVNTQHGSIGSALKAGTKTPSPVPFARALKAYAALVKAKVEKSGYDIESATKGEDDIVTAAPLVRERVDVPVMLLNSIDEENARALLADPAWGMEVKHDGERRLIVIDGGDAYGVNRTGQKVALAPAIREAALAAPSTGRTILDGEDMGDRVVVFDVLMFDGQDLTTLPFSSRIQYRDEVHMRLRRLDYTATLTSYEQKQAMLDVARATTQEGVVFKRLDAPYTDGRPNSGGAALKWKFVESATCRVASIHPTKRSVGLELLDQATGEWIGVGNVTIPPNHEVPSTLDLVEIQYLFAHRGGSLFQPVYLGQRSDIAEGDCHTGQLKCVDDRQPLPLAA